MDLEARLKLIGQVGEEILTAEELRHLLETKSHPVAYDGFEPSGRIHIAQGLLRAINVNTLCEAGIHFKMFVADWHAWANNKMDGNLDHIRTVGEYFIEVWRMTGMNLDHVEFVWANDLLDDRDYWKTVMQVARHSTLQRILRTTQIMGRSESDVLQASQIFYPCMQAADIFELGADIAQLGMDQRKVNVLARELAEKLGRTKPVAVHHHMLMGLGEPARPPTETGQRPEGPRSASQTLERATAMKMSKSNPDSAIFMTDSTVEIARKINKAYCPERRIDENPILEYNKYILFQHPRFSSGLTIERPEKFGGTIHFETYGQMAQAFAEGALHPADLKKATASSIDMLIAPVRDHFAKNAKARH